MNISQLHVACRWMAVRFLLLLIALLAAGCSSATTVTSATTVANTPTVGSTNAVTGTPAAAASGIQPTSTAEPAPAASDWSAGVSVSIELRAPTGWSVDGVFQNEYDEPSMHWQLLLQLSPEQLYAYLAFDGVAEPGDAGCTQVLQQGEDAYERSSFEGIDESESNGWSPSDVVRPVDDLTQIFPSESLLDTLEIEYTSGEAQVVVVPLDRDQFALALQSVGSIGGVNTDFDSGELTATLDDHGRLVALVLNGEYLDDEEHDFGDTTARRMRSYHYEMYAQPLDSTTPRVTPSTSMAESDGCLAPTAVVPGVWILRNPHVPDGSDFMTVDFTADGTIIGSSGCLTFGGTFRFGFAQLLDADLSTSQDLCEADGYYSQFLDILRSNPRVALFRHKLVISADATFVVLEPNS